MNEALDRYSDAGIDDEQDFEDMTAAQRRAAEAKMERRDRTGRRGRRAARRSLYPGFMESDEEDEGNIGGDLLSGMKRRTRRQYDERKDIDDMDGIEDVSCLITLHCDFSDLKGFRKYPWNS